MSYTYGTSQKVREERLAEDLLARIANETQIAEAAAARAKTEEAKAVLELSKRRESAAKAAAAETLAKQRAAVARHRALELKAEMLETENAAYEIELKERAKQLELMEASEATKYARMSQDWASKHYPEDFATCRGRLAAATREAFPEVSGRGVAYTGGGIAA